MSDYREEALGHAETLREMAQTGQRTEASLLPSETALIEVYEALQELREAAAAVVAERDAFSGAQYDVTDSIAYVDNQALKALRAVLAKTE